MNRIQTQYYSALAHCQRGATAIEYALIAGLIAAVIVGAVTLIGGGMSETFTTICNAVVTDGCAES